MGKAKKGKKHSHQPKALGNLLLASDRLQQQQQEKQQRIHDRYRLSELQTNLNSLLPEKRSKACKLLSNIYFFNRDQEETLDVLTSPTILNSLLARLADISTVTIQVHASRAILSLSETESWPIMEKLMTSGIYRTMISLVMNNIDPSHFVIPTAESQSAPSTTFPVAIEFELTLFQNLLYAIINIVSHYPMAIQEIISTSTSSDSESSKNFIQYLFNVLQIPQLHLRGVNTILNAFIVLSKLPSAQALAQMGVPLFQQYLSFLLRSKLLPESHFGSAELSVLLDHLAQRLKSSLTGGEGYQEWQYDHWVLVLQTVEILCNISLRSNQQSDPLLMFYVRVMIGLLQVLSRRQSEEVTVSIADVAKEIEAESLAKQNYNQESIDMEMEEETTEELEGEGQMKEEAEEKTTSGSISSSQPLLKAQNLRSSHQGRKYLPSMTSQKIELIEIISDLLTSFLRVIRRQYRSQLRSLHITEEEEESSSDRDETSISDLGALQSNSAAAIFLQTCEAEGLLSGLFSQTMNYLKEMFQYCVIPSRVHSIDGDLQHVILSEGVWILSVLEKITISVDDYSVIKPLVMSQTGFDLSQYLQHLQFLYECTNHITAKLEPSTATSDSSSATTTRSAIESWKAKEEQELFTLKTTILQQSMTYFHVLLTFFRTTSHPHSRDSVIAVVTNEATMKSVLVPLLLYWMNLPQFELLVSVSQILQQLIAIYCELLSTTPLIAGEATFPVPKSIYILLMNSMMNRMQHAACYLYDISNPRKDASQRKKKNNKKRSNKSHPLNTPSKRSKLVTPSKSVHVSWQESKQYNLQKNTLLWMDILVNSLIDLNASDHQLLHQWFQALQLSEKLYSFGQEFRQKLQQLLQFHHENYSYIAIKDVEEEEEENEDEDEEIVAEKERLLPTVIRLTVQDREKLEETLMNVEQFILYKQNFRM